MLSVEAVQLRLTWLVLIIVATRLAGAAGGVLSGLLTMTDTGEAVAVLPAASRAVAVIVCEDPSIAVLVSQGIEYGTVISSMP